VKIYAPSNSVYNGKTFYTCTKKNEEKGGGKLENCSIDKLAIVADPVNADSVDRLEKYFQEDLLLGRSMTAFPYRYMYKLPFHAGVVMIADRNDKVRQLRFEFNPKHSKRDDVEAMYKRILSFMKYPEIKRLDLAFDYAENLSEMRWSDSKSRPSSNHYDGKGAVQTHYVGGKRSKLNIVMYDKRAEQAYSQGIDPEELGEKEWWRIEVRLNSSDEVTRFMNDDTYNPFDEATPYYPMGIGLDGLKLSEKAMLIALFTEHGQALMAEMSRPSRAKYKQMMKDYSLPTPVDIRGDFETQKNDLRTQVVSWIKHTKLAVF